MFIKIIILNFQPMSQYIHSSKYSQFYLRSAENHQTMTAFLKIEISYSNNIEFEIVGFYCINFVFGPSIFIKSLNEINLLEIYVQTYCQNLEASLFRTRNIKKTLKLSLILLLPLKSFSHLSDT